MNLSSRTTIDSSADCVPVCLSAFRYLPQTLINMLGYVDMCLSYIEKIHSRSFVGQVFFLLRNTYIVTPFTNPIHQVAFLSLHNSWPDACVHAREISHLELEIATASRRCD